MPNSMSQCLPSRPRENALLPLSPAHCVIIWQVLACNSCWWVDWLVKWRIIGSVQCWISSSSTYNKRARGIQLGLEFSTLVVCWNYLENSFKKWRPKLHFYRLILLLVKTRICWYKVYKGDFNVWPGLRIIVFEKSGLYFWRRGYIAQPWRVHFSRYWN